MNTIEFSAIKEQLKDDAYAQREIARELAISFGKAESGKYVLPAQRERQAAAWLVAMCFEAPIYGAFLSLALEAGGLYRHCNALTSKALLFRKEKDAKQAASIEAARESELLKRQFAVTISEVVETSEADTEAEADTVEAVEA